MKLQPIWDRSVFQLRHRAERCRQKLLSYRVPIVRVETDELDEARELFVRINSAGTPIAAADRAFARAARFDLRDHAERAWADLLPDFQGIGHEALLQARALLDGISTVGAEAMEQVAEEWDARIGEDHRAIAAFSKEWRAQQKATQRAIDLLRSKFYVLSDALLPSQYMVSTLTVFFFHSPKQPTSEQLSQIRKWFWATALGQRYSGSGHRQNILDDALFFERLAQGKETKFRIGELIDPGDLRRATYGRRSSIADAFYCLLIAQKPQHFANGTEVHVAGAASLANRRHKHHIFPRQLLLRDERLGKRVVNSVLNLSLISAEENSRVGAKAPHRYLEPYRKHRHFDRVMRSHLIPHEEDSALWLDASQGYTQFLREREVMVCKAFEEVAGAKLFRSPRTPG